MTRIASPTLSQPWSVSNVSADTFYVFAMVDMNNNGLTDAGDITNISGKGPTSAITVSGNVYGADLTLTNSNGLASLTTDHGQSQSGSDWYNLGFVVTQQTKLPVKVALTSGPGFPEPIDIGNSDGAGYFQWSNSPLQTASVGDTYTLSVTYSDSSSEVLTVSVLTILNCFAQNLSMTTSNPYSRLVPLFRWTAPASPPPVYTYSIQVSSNGGGGGWYYPNQSNGMPSTQTSVVYNTDSSGPALIAGTMYNWYVSVRDTDGNSATYQTTYTP